MNRADRAKNQGNRRRFPGPALLLLFALFLSATPLIGAEIRITTWNLDWFPNGKPQEMSPERQQQRITEAADVLRPLNPDIILLQEMKDYDTCARLGEAIEPHKYQVAICSAFKQGPGIGKQQVAILAKENAQAAWSEPWKSMEGVDPPRGFAFAWFKIRGADVGIYSVHLKSNLVIRGDKAVEREKNVHKREVAARQLIGHMHEVLEGKLPAVKSVVVGGDFNTNAEEFADDTSLETLVKAGFASCMQNIAPTMRVTHPGGHGYPDTTFDYIFARNANVSAPEIIRTKASDHLPVTCTVTIPSTSETIAANGNRQPATEHAADTVPAMLRNSDAGAANASTTASAIATPATAYVTITQPITIKVPYGTTVLQPGTKLPVVARNPQTVNVRYMDAVYPLPAGATN
jgi:endonuclease/exonuclease/phosphatase family metal-dependent hydrolase